MKVMTKNISNFVFYFMTFFLCATVFYLRYKNLPYYPFHEDGIAEMQLIDRIVQGDLIFSNELFLKSPLGHILLSIPIFFLDGNLYSYRLTNIVLSLGVMVLMICLGRTTRQPLAGYLCAAFIGFSGLENLYVGFVRYYIVFQFFFCASIFFIYRFFILKERSTIKYLIFCVLCAMLSHKLAFQLVPILLLATFFSGRDYLVENKKSIQLMTLVLGGAAFYHFSGGISLMPREYQNWQMGQLGAMLLSGDYFGLYNYFMDFVPFGWTFVFSSLLLYPWHKDKGLLFFSLAFVFLMAATTILAIAVVPRYIAHLFPLGVFVAIWMIIQCARSIWFALIEKSWGLLLVWSLLPLVVMLTLTKWNLENYSNFDVIGRSTSFIDQEKPHLAITKIITDGDMLLSVDPGVTQYYTGKDKVYFLRQKYDLRTNTYTPFDSDQVRNDLIDTPEKLLQLLAMCEGTIWLYGNYKYQETVSSELTTIINNNLQQVLYYDEANQIFVLGLKSKTKDF